MGSMVLCVLTLMQPERNNTVVSEKAALQNFESWVDRIIVAYIHQQFRRVSISVCGYQSPMVLILSKNSKSSSSVPLMLVSNRMGTIVLPDFPSPDIRMRTGVSGVSLDNKSILNSLITKSLRASSTNWSGASFSCPITRLARECL